MFCMHEWIALGLFLLLSCCWELDACVDYVGHRQNKLRACVPSMPSRWIEINVNFYYDSMYDFDFQT